MKQLTRLLAATYCHCCSHRQFFDKQAPRLPDVDVRPPTPEPEPEPEVFLGSEWEGRLKRLRDLWSIEPEPAEALIALRAELRDRIAMLSKVYIAYCAVDGHGQKIPQGRSFGVEDNRLASQLQQGGDGNTAAEALDNLLVVRVPSVAPPVSEEKDFAAASESVENTDSTAPNVAELRTTMLFVKGLVGDLAEDEEALSAIFGQFGIVLLVDIHDTADKPNWAFVSFLRPSDADEAMRKGADEMAKQLEADGCAFDDKALRVEYFDTRQALGERQLSA